MAEADDVGIGAVGAGGLRCGEILARLDRYVEGSLEGAELAAVVAHVRECPACTRFGGAYAQVVASLRGGPEPGGPPVGVVDRLTARLRAQRA